MGVSWIKHCSDSFVGRIQRIAAENRWLTDAQWPARQWIRDIIFIRE